MIRTRLDNLNPDTLDAMCCELVACTYKPLEESSLCDCICKDCLTILPRFAKVGGEEKENDTDSFLFRVLNSTDSGTLELWKQTNSGDVKQADLNVSTYGTYYPLGSFTNVSGQELYLGYVLDWESVLSNFGIGKYYVKANLTIFGSNTNQFSPVFDLQEYTDERADGTFVLKTIQNGNILRS